MLRWLQPQIKTKQLFILKIATIVVIFHFLIFLCIIKLTKKPVRFFKITNLKLYPNIEFKQLNQKFKDFKNNEIAKKNKKLETAKTIKQITTKQIEKTSTINSNQIKKTSAEANKKQTKVTKKKNTNIQFLKLKTKLQILKKQKILENLKQQTLKKKLTKKYLNKKQADFRNKALKKILKKLILLKNKKIKIKQNIAKAMQNYTKNINNNLNNTELNNKNHTQKISHLELNSSIETALKKELYKVLKLPLGMENYNATFKIKLDKFGKITQLKCIKSSTINLFDIEATTALNKINYPKELSNSKFFITLGNECK